MIKTEEIVINVCDLCVAYDRTPVIENVNVTIPKGAMAAIIGPNGAGKTTFMKAILGLVKPVKGQVTFFDGHKTIERNIRRQIGYVPQSGSVDWDFPINVFDTVLMGSYGQLGWVRRAGKRERDKARKVIKQVGMSNYSGRQISQLSGGQQQRVFLARALMQDASVYLLDEPFKGVDVTTEKIIVQILKEMRSIGKTIVMVHHDLSTVKEYFDWVVLINKSVVVYGREKEVFTDENIKATFLRML